MINKLSLVPIFLLLIFGLLFLVSYLSFFGSKKARFNRSFDKLFIYQ